MNFSILYICVLLHLKVSLILAANILVFLPLPLSSHTRAFKPLFKELASRGHNITFYTAIPFNKDIPNLKQIVIRNFLEEWIENTLTKDSKGINGWKHIIFIWEFGLKACEGLFKEKPIKELIQSTDLSFDLILLETFFIHEPFAALGHKFKAPIINLHPFRAEEWISEILRNPQPLSYVSNIRLPITDNMNFYERFTNIIYSLIQTVTGHFYYIPNQEKLMRKYFKYPGSKDLPPLLDLLKSTSLTLADGNSVVSFSSPSLPNIISIGGIHISPNKNLSAELQKFIEESPNGIVYFSLGSMVKISSLPSEILTIYMKVLGNLPQRILWKWESDKKMAGQPSNILTSKWFPQLDILAHPKCRAFMTHGGFHSVLEATYYGVPIVGSPVFADQESNLVMAINKGYGQMVKFENFNEEILSLALDKVLNDPSYKKNAEILSQVIKDVPMTPLETAIYWVEHVIRHKGAEHLKVAGTHLPWYTYYLCDIMLATMTITSLVTFLLYKVIKTIAKFIPSLLNKNDLKVKEIKKKKKE